VKLDKVGEYIICDSPRGGGFCGGRIARVQPEGDKRVLAVLPGWERSNDGTWHEPPNDVRRRQLGHPARSLPRRLTGTHGALASWRFPMLHGGARLMCSDCQAVHDIRPKMFGLAPAGDVSMITEKRVP
jgi:hypothetical protein